ncbi:MAG: methylenetetrahydrofolate--tRNA-(uracil(54)-C(5))-methyltransferase (FADH(2)-oxidizing) TrmFO [Deltaproteobacteria bacterium]|nr:methylenetetrahydrofolate--tRNA-(uracil(54)-C(5))-methyltransferase (FADH(2)-oxidizing) TrmFO [Deltaproteobacteria bacterium]
MVAVRVVGGGLAGCEAAWQLAVAGHDVTLHEMKPGKRTPAQHTNRLCELVCSNSLRSNNVENAVGLLKEELRRGGSLVLRAAEHARVPAGDALAVDRDVFSRFIEDALASHPHIRRVSEEVLRLPDDGVPTVIATGPLTADALAADIRARVGRDALAFYDAIAPIVEADSIDRGQVFAASRWGKGESADYLNCPLTEEEYNAFVDGLVHAEKFPLHAFEEPRYFEGCLPAEVMAARGRQTLAYGPMKPVGLTDPRTGRRPFAVVQLRKEDVAGSAYNLVGFQTRLTQPEQRRVFGIIPALRQARFLRYGAVHRNSYLDSPRVLDDRLALPALPHVRFAGQVTGVEGYVESCAIGFVVGRMLAAELSGRVLPPPPPTTALGALYGHTRAAQQADKTARYDPSNVTWAMFPPLPGRHRKDDRKRLMSERALAALPGWLE